MYNPIVMTNVTTLNQHQFKVDLLLGLWHKELGLYISLFIYIYIGIINNYFFIIIIFYNYIIITVIFLYIFLFSIGHFHLLSIKASTAMKIIDPSI